MRRWITGYDRETERLVVEECFSKTGMLEFWYCGCIPITRTLAMAIVGKPLPKKLDYFLETTT